jgi:hypothetical protein
MTDTTGPRVDAYSDALPGWQRAFCGEVRQLLVRAAGSQVTETIMRTNRPCFVLEGCIPLRRGHRPGPGGSSPQAMPARPAAPWPSGTAKQSPRPR